MNRALSPAIPSAPVFWLPAQLAEVPFSVGPLHSILPSAETFSASLLVRYTSYLFAHSLRPLLIPRQLSRSVSHFFFP